MAAICVLSAIVVLSSCSSGSQPKTPVPGTSSSVPATPGKAAPPVVMPTGPAAQFKVSHMTSAGPVMVTTLAGKKSGVTGKVWVWTPPEYKDPRYARSGFPVLMLYTGDTGVNYNFWAHEEVEPTQAENARLAKAGKAHPFIMIMPVLQLSKQQDTECSDRPGQPKMGTWLGEDVVDMVKANFRTLPGRDGWGMAGASSGAFCAAKLTLQHPGQFKAAVSWCGYFVPEPETGPRWSPQEMLENSPEQMLKQGQPNVRLLLLAGDKRLFHADTDRIKAFMKLVRPPTVVTSYIQPGGGHYTADLKKLLPNILEFLTENLQGPVPG
jgi:enterochelin esterase-like enzyme